MMSSFASLRLVLQSTRVAAKALRALATTQAVFPTAQLVVDESLRSIATALRQVDETLPLRPLHLLPECSASAVQQAVEEVLEDAPWPRDPALIQQEIEGCKMLLLEVVRRAAYDWVLYRTSRRMLHKRLAEDAFTWLFQEDEDHPNWEERVAAGKEITSFLSICSELDLDAETVRKYVRKLTVKNVMSVGRPAEYRRRDTSPSSMGEEHVPALRNSSWQGIEAALDSTGSDDY